MRQVVMYSREGCCLCDDARAVLSKIHEEAGRRFGLEERDIEADERWLRAYLERIPVITIDGVEAFELFVDETELRRRLGIVEAE